MDYQFTEHTPAYDMQYGELDSSEGGLHCRRMDYQGAMRALIISAGKSQMAASKLYQAFWLPNFTQGRDLTSYCQVVNRSNFDNVGSILKRNHVLA
jgi:hypothetical protein